MYVIGMKDFDRSRTIAISSKRADGTHTHQNGCTGQKGKQSFALEFSHGKNLLKNSFSSKGSECKNNMEFAEIQTKLHVFIITNGFE